MGGPRARESVLRAPCLGRTWESVGSWWGAGLDRVPLEVDVVARSADGTEILVGEAKWQARLDWARETAALRQKAARLPLAQGRTVRLAIWTKAAPARVPRGVACLTPGTFSRRCAEEEAGSDERRLARERDLERREVPHLHVRAG